MTFRIFLSLMILVLSQVAFADGDENYKLASGDVLSISVYGEKDFSLDEIRLNDEGTLSYPYLGQVQARGKTTHEVEQLIAQELKDGQYLKDPSVSVRVTTYRDFYISGEVQKPGGYPYQPGLTLDRAIALAGGLTERASTKRVTITRGKGATVSPDQVKLDTPIKPGDTITIEQGFF